MIVATIINNGVLHVMADGGGAGGGEGPLRFCSMQ